MGTSWEGTADTEIDEFDGNKKNGLVPMQATDWFHHTLGYSYNVEQQGLPADWLLDLVSIGFHNSLHSYGFKTINQLEEASQKFIQERLEIPAPNGFSSLKRDASGGSFTHYVIYNSLEDTLPITQRISLCLGTRPAVSK